MALAKWVLDWLPDKWEEDKEMVTLIRKVVGEKKYDKWKKYPVPLDLRVCIAILKAYKVRGDLEGAAAWVRTIPSEKHPPEKVRKLIIATYRILNIHVGFPMYEGTLLPPVNFNK